MLGILLKSVEVQGAAVAQSVKRPTLSFGSSRDLTVSEFEPRHDLAVSEFGPHVSVRLCADSSEPGACFRFCVSFSLCPSPMC